MINQVISKIIEPFAKCNQECYAKEIVRSYMVNFDEEQKVNYVHIACHKYGAATVLIRILAAAVILQAFFIFTILSRIK